ncbi:hypothetical protein Goklo_009098 [Gossypium klotzschianum]|uniref:Retrotransposon gag domain-containing protein n=1 Tax=Gossypium klotzschianum TaxID=34286 RepID=A0A7J8V1W4_9ROSI|nr:hypothetical protein [Gossypium klotzschianum]
MEGSQILDNPIPLYIQDLMKMMKSNEERMQMLEENKNKMVETISQLTPSSNNTLYIHLIGNTSTGAILPKKGNGENTTNASNPVLSVTIGAINTINSNTPTTYTLVTSMENHVTTNSQFGTSFLVAQPTKTQGFVTKEELQRLLEEKKNESLSFSKYDFKLSYLTRVVAKPYPKDYISPKFKKFEWQFRGILEPMCVIFGEKFFSTQEKVSLVDLGREYQKPKEDVMDYIQHFKVKVLNVQEAHNEDQLVKALWERPIILSWKIRDKHITFTSKRAASLLQIKRNHLRNSNLVVMGETFHRRSHALWKKILERWNKWVNEGSVCLPNVEHKATSGEKSSPMYCHFHKIVRHPTQECNALRKIYHGKIKNN